MKKKRKKKMEYYKGVKKVNEYLYRGIFKKGLYFVMERIDKEVPNKREVYSLFKLLEPQESKIRFWKDYYKEQDIAFEKYKKLEIKGEKLDFSGFAGFYKSLEFYKDNELWISYASIKKIKDIDTVKMEDIELSFAVMTTDKAPMVTHMGISRSFIYILNHLDDPEKYKYHDRISIPLHSFAAKVTLYRYPEKLYMITVPVSKMATIMLKSLPGHVYQGDNVSLAKNELDKIDWSTLDDKLKPIKYELKKFDKLNSRLNKFFSIELDDYIVTFEEDYDIRKLINKNYELLKKDINTKRSEYKKREKEIMNEKRDEIINSIKITKKDSPIVREYDHINGNIGILDKERKNMIWVYFRKKDIIYLSKENIEEESKKYRWFMHGYMSPIWGKGYVTIDLDALSESLTF